MNDMMIMNTLLFFVLCLIISLDYRDDLAFYQALSLGLISSGAAATKIDSVEMSFMKSVLCVFKALSASHKIPSSIVTKIQ